MGDSSLARKPAPRVTWFYRLLYRNYSRGASLSLFFNRRVTATGWVIISLLLLGALIGAAVLSRGES